MRSDVHSAALRAAAKVAFSVAFIGGCSAPVAEPATGEPADGLPTDEGAGVVATESDLSAKKPHKPKVSPPVSACHDAGAPPAPPTCDAVVAAAFPTESDYPGTKKTVSAAVKTCCVELLADSLGVMDHHRWDCCANLPDGTTNETINMACTPWGPPVPPAMKRRARRAPMQAPLAEVA